MCWPSTEPGLRVVALDPATYRRHALHDEGRAWPETNCYTDLLVEVVHALGHEPAAMLPFTVAVDFEGDQWTFFKPPACDLSRLYGLEVQELAIWRPLVEHVAEQVAYGRPVLVEVDAWFLPDTAGNAYRRAHTKTTIGVNAIDAKARRLGYFHNAGYFALEGEDFDQALLAGALPHERMLPPYVEVLKPRQGFEPLAPEALARVSAELLRDHVARAPRDNPFPRFRSRLRSDLDWLLGADLEQFHVYSFANLRQYGACFELAQASLEWLAGHGDRGLETPAQAFGRIATTAKAFQFQLARSMSRRKPLDLAPLDAMAADWDLALAFLRGR